MTRSLLLLWLALVPALVFSQNPATVYGAVTNENGDPIGDANVVIFGESGVGTVSDDQGLYSIEVPSSRNVTLVFTHVSHEDFFKTVNLEPGKFYRFQPELKERTFKTVTIEDERERREFIQSIPVEQIEYIPDPSGDPIIAALKQLGASSNNELSSQYSVRGGNFDENLVYVNDFEIYRPLLVRSGQQEGFPFPNYNMTDRIGFSAGGFEAKYGDKLSSVLDIRYKKPKDFGASVSLSLLGGNVHIQAADKEQKHGFMAGVRYKNNQYLLNSLETSGEYNPSFLDVQALYNWSVSDKLELEVLGNYSSSKFNFIPEDRSTSTGVVNNVIRLDVFFDGQEVDEFTTGMAGISLMHRPNNLLGLKWMASGYRALENENFDIIGDYWLGAVESSLGEDDFGQVAFGLGVGTFHNFARNEINSTVGNLGHIGYWDAEKHFIRWGARYQREEITDQINDWERLDSAGYSLPFSDNQVLINDVLKTTNELSSNRYNGFVQDTWTPEDSKVDFSITGGVRFSYWDLNNEFLATPRFQAAIRPDWVRKDSVPRNFVLKIAGGMYAQPPFYRELRDLDGVVNTDVRSQKSLHFLVGGDWNFRAFDRDMKFVTELYYKYLWDLVPYEVNNVQVRYYGVNAAKGYSAGIDMRLHGELVEDADSWISLSILQTRENLDESLLTDIFGAVDSEGNLLDPGYVNRPTDQRLNFGMFFQDYALNNKNFKVHLNFLFGTGLPFGPPENLILRNQFRIPPYRRVDIGFSALLLDSKRKERSGFFKDVKSIWASVEVFNLLGISNTISYIWVKDTNNTVYAFPNFLTSRRVNARLIVRI